MNDPFALNIAAFVAQALDISGSPEEMAAEVVPLKRDPNAGISSIELNSSVGPAAFLVYNYKLDIIDAKGKSGREIFNADLRTLERAAEVGTPGPRIVAHAVAENEAFILATTPDLYRTLTGQPSDADDQSTEDGLTDEERTASRRKDADELLRLLRKTDGVAQRWLRMMKTESARGRARGERGDDPVPFLDEETALALFLLDNESIQHVLQMLNLMIESAHRRTEEARIKPNGHAN